MSDLITLEVMQVTHCIVGTYGCSYQCTELNCLVTLETSHGPFVVFTVSLDGLGLRRMVFKDFFFLFLMFSVGKRPVGAGFSITSLFP